ncbi:MAG: GAF domain-containing protein, partial [Chloroflexi bacterium]|nr:GAF domain-containing protein [Chloroflexota bacterium]
MSGKINLNTILPLSVLEDVIPCFENFTGAAYSIAIADTQGDIYYGNPGDHPCRAQAAIEVDHHEVGQVLVYAAAPEAPAAPAAAFMAQVLSQIATETWRRQELAEEVLARYDELNLIYDLGDSFVQGVPQDEIFKSVLLETNRIVRADAGIIYSWDARQSTLIPVSYFGDQIAPDFWQGRVQELALSTLYAYEETQLFDAEKIICAPLRYDDQLLGILVLLYEAENKTFKANDVNLLTALAQNTSLFIYAVRLLAERAERNAQLETALAELQATRDQLSRAERLSIIGQTVGSLVHDMRNPLNNVMGYAGILQEENVTFEERYQYAGQIIKYVTVFSSMAQEILDYIQGDENVKKAPARVDDIMEQVADLLNPPGLEQPVKILMNYETARGFTINVDRPRFVRVFQNLVNNSIDAIETNGGTQVE